MEPDKIVVRKTKPAHLFIDQYNEHVWARTIRELKQQVGPGRVFKIYVDKKDGRTVQVGTGIGRRWFNRYIPWEKERA